MIGNTGLKRKLNNKDKNNKVQKRLLMMAGDTRPAFLSSAKWCFVGYEPEMTFLILMYY